MTAGRAGEAPARGAPAERVELVPATRPDGGYSREFLEALMQLPPGGGHDSDDSD